MVRYLPFLLEIALVLYAMIDCLQTEERRVRNLPKLAWIVLIVIAPIVGPLAWLFAGRPRREGASGTWPLKPGPGPELPRALAPDDDPAFLAKLKKTQDDETLLKKWEEDLRRREEELRRGDDPDASKP